jgi:hypothetical protein
MKRRRRRNPAAYTSPFGLGIIGLAMVGTGIFAAWAWKNMSQADRDKFLSQK